MCTKRRTTARSTARNEAMACENENATATYGSLHDAFSAFKRADGAQTSAFGAGKASASAPAPATVHGSLSAAIAASGSLTSEPVAADGVQTAALAPAADAAPVSAPGAAYGAQSSASAAADRAPASSLAAVFKASQRRSADRSGSQATMPVAERFVSINGEGACAGKLAAFIRFTGCNLRCGRCGEGRNPRAVGGVGAADRHRMRDAYRW